MLALKFRDMVNVTLFTDDALTREINLYYESSQTLN